MRLFLLAVLFSLTTAPAFAQGYDGLFAPADDKPAKSEPQGYGGVVPGSVPQPAAPAPEAKGTPHKSPNAKNMFNQTPKPVPQKNRPAASKKRSTSANPAIRERKPVETSEQMKDVAHLQRYLNENPPQQAAGVNPKYANLRVPKIEGLSVQEYSLKTMIDGYMEDVNDPKNTPEQRKKEAQFAYENLKLIADGLRVKKMVPDKSYLEMGMPPEFVKEERESNENSMRRLDEAFNKLRPLQ